MKTIHVTFAVLLALLVFPLRATAAETHSIHAILITATNLKREADPKLAPYEANLQRNIPLSSFRYVSEGSVSVPVGGQVNLNLTHGHRLVLNGEKSGGQSIRVRVQWLNARKELINTTVTLPPGGTTVLGRRPPGDEETPIVLVIAR